MSASKREDDTFANTLKETSEIIEKLYIKLEVKPGGFFGSGKITNQNVTNFEFAKLGCLSKISSKITAVALSIKKLKDSFNNILNEARLDDKKVYIKDFYKILHDEYLRDINLMLHSIQQIEEDKHCQKVYKDRVLSDAFLTKVAKNKADIARIREDIRHESNRIDRIFTTPESINSALKSWEKLIKAMPQPPSTAPRSGSAAAGGSSGGGRTRRRGSKRSHRRRHTRRKH
jgi:hypothetical protein